MKKYRILRQGIVLSIIFCSIIFSISMSSATDKTYYLDRTNGVSIAGYTTNWTSCSSSSPQIGFRITSLSSSASSCTNGALSISNAGDMFLAIFPTAYSSDAQIIGKTNAKFYLKSNSGSATYRFDLGYARTGIFTSLGNVIKTGVSTSGGTYTIDMSTISGIAPAGSNLALKVSVTTSGGGKIYIGTGMSNSGRFYVNETAVMGTPIPTPTPTATPIPTATPTPTPTATPTPTPTATPTPTPTATPTATPTPTPTPTPTATPTATPTGQYLVKVSTNRYVVLDDPNEPSTAASGFFKPSDLRGGSYGSNYWSGESTTIRAIALITDNNGTPKSGVTVNFNLRNPGTSVDTASSTSDADGMAYYSFNLNEQKYWGYWKIDALAGSSQGSAFFALNFWGCGQCHGKKDPGKWGMYTPKSYYTMGYDFHKSQNRNRHTEPMRKGVCQICHQMYTGTPFNYELTGKGNTFVIENEYSSDWHNGKVKCQECHAGSDISSTPQGKNPEIAGCYDTAGCHTKKNTNLTRVNSTTGYIVGGNYRTKYSAIPTNSANAHSGESVECIACHGAGHNISKPYNVTGTSNTYTENEQCWTCHTNRVTTHIGNSNCVSCHSQDAHNISGGGGPDCKACHDVGGPAPKIINFSIANSAAHKDLNSGASYTVNAENKKCWACHGNGMQPGSSEHPSGQKACENCHTGTGEFSAPIVREHNQYGEDVKTTVACILCHDNDGMFIDGGGIGTITHYIKYVTNTATTPYGHLGPINTSNCLICHRGQYTADPIWGSPMNITTGKVQHPETTTQCDCHKDDTVTTLANVDFHHRTLGAGGGSNCVGCHAGAE